MYNIYMCPLPFRLKRKPEPLKFLFWPNFVVDRAVAAPAQHIFVRNALGSGPDARLPRGNRARAAYFSLHFSDFSVFWALESCITSHFFSWLGGRFDIRGWKSSQSNPTNQIQPIQSSQWVKWVNIWVCLFKIFLCFEPLKFLKCRSKMWSNASIPANPTNPIQKIQSSQWVKWVNILVCLFHIFFMFGVCSG